VSKNRRQKTSIKWLRKKDFSFNRLMQGESSLAMTETMFAMNVNAAASIFGF
jgi:hypothetical protein